MEPERLEDRLTRLELERTDADRTYNERLTAVDQSLLRAPEFPHPPPPFDDTQVTPLNEAWNILPQGPPATDRSLKGRLRGFIWRLVGPSIQQQQTFNAALVDHINRNVAAHREAERAISTTIELVRAQTTALVHFQAMLLQLLQSLTLYVDTKDRSVGGQIHVLNGALSALADDWMRHWESQRAHEARFESGRPALMRAYEELSQKVSLVHQTVMLLKREVERIDTSAPASAKPAAGKPQHPSTSAPQHLSTMSYVGFENRFRGSEDEITSRLRDYVPMFSGAAGPVIDIGCGRGELLQLFREAGIAARGLDVTPAMVDVCHERGLDAVVGDAVTFLDAQPDQSLGGVIAIQVVEHLEPSYLAQLLDLAFHKLRPGAPMVLETINPACWVAFFDSYIRDTTHRWPLHPETLQYMVQAAGFAHASIVYKSPVAEADRLQDVPVLSPREGRGHNPVLADVVEVMNANMDKLNARLFTDRDYAIVARR